ncbi:WD40-repeat-containing domain protein [Catenaria anguillulae PL171]|uniref:WD40-repeat-containing domain protein n=1 Tax=Catenaria anguillulae PL171 TaxID=765915 RepID=A0A1Y2HGW8_9FUNG|nr:WD40-repeat-containing domain protein [Catenaria anguillulae PL171]
MLEQERIAAEEKLINEEYKIWKKNSPFLYDTLVTHALEWPTLTTQWFPDVDAPEGKDYIVCRMLLGTHTSDKEQNYLQIATVQLPRVDLAADSRVYDEDRGEVGGYGGAQCKIQIQQRIPHDGEINRARYMPQKPDVIATKTVMGDVYLFDRTKFPLQPNPNNIKCTPTVRLTGHTAEGYGLAWSPLTTGALLSSAEDTLICHWDVQGVTKEKSALEPLRIYRGHASVVGDVSWHHHQPSIFASVGDDRKLLLWDSRSTSATAPSLSVPDAHAAEVNAVDCSPFSEFLLATAGNDRTVRIWDTRNLGLGAVATLESHSADVVSVQWHPTEGSVLASAGADRRVMVWDLSRLGDEQTPEDAEDGPPELLFIHGGHTNRVADIAWNPAMPWTMASAAEDNIVQVWQMAKAVYETGMEEVPDNMLE